MTVRIVGPWCSRCGERPAQRCRDLCSQCDRLVRAFHPDDEISRAIDRLDEWAATLTHSDFKERE